MITSTATISTRPKSRSNQYQRIGCEVDVAVLDPGRRLWRPPAGGRADPVRQSGGGAERICGRPVLTSNQSMVWHLLRSSNILDSVEGFGRLFKGSGSEAVSA